MNRMRSWGFAAAVSAAAVLLGSGCGGGGGGGGGGGINPLEAFIKASNTGTGDAFGRVLAIDGDTLVVAAPFEESGAVGVNPGPAGEADNTAPFAGAVYVFVRSGVLWSQQAYLKASNTGGGDGFGDAVAISGDTIVVGAPSEDSIGTGVNPGPIVEADDSAGEAGAAYVFVRSGTTWTQQAYLKASNTDAGDAFGTSVAISGDTIVVGAGGEASAATGIDPPQGEVDDSAPGAGAAYVFVRSGTTWTQQAYVKASNTDGGDDFGAAVAIDGDTMVVGADGEGSNGAGGQADDTAPGAGAAYVFLRTGTAWAQQAYVKASNVDAADGFGFPAALEGDTLVVGALGEASAATGVNPGPAGEADDTAPNAGAAYVFLRSGTTWSQQAYIKASNTDASDQFARWLDLSGDLLVIGANNESSAATVINPGLLGEADDTAPLAGAAYLFSRSGVIWTQDSYIKPPNTDGGDRFGVAVGLSGTTVVVGAQGESSSASGVNPGPAALADDSAPDAGAVYVYPP